MSMSTYNFRASKEWARRAANALNALGKPLGIDRSELIRLCLDQEEILFCHSPYVVTRAQHFILVEKTGTVHYWAEEEVRLLERRFFMPYGIRLKPPTRKRFLEGAKSLDELRAYWLLNYFSAHDAGKSAASPRADGVDEVGLLEKGVDLQIDRARGVPLLRERFAVVRDFVQHDLPGDTSPENAGVPVDVPTLDLRVYVVVDRDLYDGDRFLQGSARVDFDFRNLDSARFQRHILGFGSNETVFYGDVYPEIDADHRDGAYDKIRASVDERAGRYFQRLQHITDDQATTQDGRAIVKDSEIREQLYGTALPERFLFGEFRWARPYIGTIVNMTWPRPPRA